MANHRHEVLSLSLTYTAAKSDGADLPAWLSFTAATRTFAGTPGTADVGTVSVKVTASDGTALVSDTFDIVVGAPFTLPWSTTMAHSRGEGDYRGGSDRGTVEASLTGVIPTGAMHGPTG